MGLEEVSGLDWIGSFKPEKISLERWNAFRLFKLN